VCDLFTVEIAMLLTRLIILASALCASLAAANTPPIPPPDPASLAAAEKLVAALPLENVLDSFDAHGITNEVADKALAWLATRLPQERNEMVKQIFYEKVKTESRSRLAAAIGDTRVALADGYARQLSERDLKGAQTFALTPEGKAFLEVQIGGDVGVRSLVSYFIYYRTFADLPRILQSARDSSRVLEQVNRKH
jgi:hypothetical protein